ncbi:MAG: signal recognition particle-docking protein FtsY [Candidatus Woesearchaeota archaeon]|nr:MAG: signal recognition particle-docking protein FtsY [Candidatus Woesearchaeota archaeon]
MFGKIKERLKNVFRKGEEIIEEAPQDLEELQENTPEEKEEEKVPERSENKVIPEPLEKEKETKKNKEKEEEEKTRKQEAIPTPIPSYKEEQITPKKKEETSPQVSAPNPEEKQKKTDEEKETGEEEEEKKPEKKGFFTSLFKGKKKEEEPNEEQEKELLEEGTFGKKETPEPEKEQTKEKDSSIISKTFGKLLKKNLSENDFDALWLELEIFLLEINVAYEIVEKIGTSLKKNLLGHSFDRFSLTKKIKEVLEQEVETILLSREASLLSQIKQIQEKEEIPTIMLLGVNGTGKTTTIAKLVKYFQDKNLKLVVAAADTFRAAATEQLGEHAKNLNVKLITHKGGSDPAAVAFDAVEHAKAKKLDIVLIDTAGRMPNNANLLSELQKIKRVSKSQLSVFIGDSISGNDLLEQISLFDKALGLDGIILTKVDTDERPGSLITTAYSIEKPIYFLGVGQKYEDFVEFNAKHIAKQLFSLDEEP